MTAHINQFTFTVEEYHKLAELGILKDTDRVELIKGKIIIRSPIKSTHAGIVNRMFRILINKLGLQLTITAQNPITIQENSEPELDIVIAHFKADDYESAHPNAKEIYIVIEASDSTLAKDREIKRNLYAEANIPEYWIVNIIDRQIEIHRQPKNGEYHFKQIISEEEEIECDFKNRDFYVFADSIVSASQHYTEFDC